MLSTAATPTFSRTSSTVVSSSVSASPSQWEAGTAVSYIRMRTHTFSVFRAVIFSMPTIRSIMLLHVAHRCPSCSMIAASVSSAHCLLTFSTPSLEFG